MQFLIEFLFDNFNRFFTGVSNVTVQLLQNESSYIIPEIIKYLQRQKDETQQLL
jgi:hypothetical protein